MEHSLGILSVIVGVMILAWAFVRPRRGDEPHCRRCRFSLAGLTEPAKCPECGRDQSPARSTVIGQRPSPMWSIVKCTICILIGSLLVGLDRMNLTGFFPLNDHKPAWLLQTEAYTLGDLRASRASIEIIDRVTDGSLTTSARDTLVKTALARHAQTWRTFPDAQWDVITMAINRGELTLPQIERVWNDCTHSPVLLSSGRHDLTYFPGEEMTLSAGVRTRSGDYHRNNDLRDCAFLVGQSLYLTLRADTGEPMKPITRSSYNAFLPGRSMANGSSAPDEREYAYIHAPSELGVYHGEIEYELWYKNISRKMQQIEDELEESDSLKKSFSFPVTFRVVPIEQIDVPAIDPLSLREDTGSLMQFEVNDVECVDVLIDDMQVVYRSQYADVSFGVSHALDPDIGLGGYLVFVQGKHSREIPINIKPRELQRQSVSLRGFTPGPIAVSYRHNHEVAVQERVEIPRVLGGTIDLSTITLPEPEAE